ncbi:MAG: hypothetical protein AVDCRST_MAG05-3830, partial [uncultured Rubrobacteraceae bacterium]
GQRRGGPDQAPVPGGRGDRRALHRRRFRQKGDVHRPPSWI